MPLIVINFAQKSSSSLVHRMSSSRKNPYSPLGRSLEIPRGRGILEAKILEAMYEDKLEFPRWEGGETQITFCGGSMDIFWNRTI